MSTLVNAMRTSDTFTENGMVTNSSSLSATLNLFFVIGAIRNQMKTEDGKNRLIGLFEAAHNEVFSETSAEYDIESVDELKII